MNIELKSCPFCGAEAQFFFFEYRGIPCIAVKCTHCAARADAAILDEMVNVESTLDFAADHWNLRV